MSGKTVVRSIEEVMYSPKGTQAIGEITHSQAMPEVKKPGIGFSGYEQYKAQKEIRDLDRQLQANKKDYQAMDATAAQEVQAIVASKKSVPLIYTGVKDHQAQKGIRDLDKQLKAKTKEYQGIYIPANKTNSNPDDQHNHHPNVTPKVSKPIIIGKRNGNER